MKTRRHFSVLWAGLIALITGCVVGPDFTPVPTDAPPDWNADLPPGLQRDDATLSQWWTTFNDPLLTDLVERAVDGNPNLRQAAERIHEARAQRAIVSGGRFPTLNAAGLALHAEASENAMLMGLTDNYYATGFDASWELDLFGRIQRQVEAADAMVEATEERYRDVLIMLIAEVALNYVELRSSQERLSILNANRESQEQTLELVQASVDVGEVSRLDLEQAKSNLELTRSQVPMLQLQIEQAMNRLSVLLGLNPGVLDRELTEPANVPVVPASLAIGVPAEALRRRPDVREAERVLAAQTAQIGVAEADLYPRFGLSGSIGLFSTRSADLFTNASRTFGFGPTVAWNIFDAGRIRANIDVQTARQAQALLAYEATILVALRDVENAIVSLGKEQIRRASLVRAEEAANQAVSIARDLYRTGETSFLSVLDSERSLLAVQDQLAISNARSTSFAISLFKALGGGWTALAPEDEPVPSGESMETQEASRT